MTAGTVVNRFVQAVAHGGWMKPTLQVVHDAETPLKAGYAASIAENWFGSSSSGVETSAHFMVDPVEIVRMLSDNVVAYAVGPNANGFTLNWEQAGYASLSRAQWTTPAGMDQMDLLAAGLRERGLANGIPLRWASDDDIRAAAHGVPGGICYHDDIRRVLAGTSHTDPTPNYPRDLLMQRVVAEPDPPEEDLLATIKYAVIFAREEDGTYWECSMLAGIRVPVRSLQTLADRKHWLSKTGVPWQDVGTVGRIDAFGVPVAVTA